MQILLQDLRFALRQIIRNPGFSLTAVLSLTLGIGATVAVYSILYDAVLHPWPYAGIERVCDVSITAPDGQDPQPVAVLSYKFWQRHYRGDPAIGGKSIQLNHKAYSILGVMPVRFTW